MALATSKGFTNYADHEVIGNCLDSSRCISMEALDKKLGGDKSADAGGDMDRVLRCLYLLCINKERSPDIDNVISFATFLKERGCNDIVIDIYGVSIYKYGGRKTSGSVYMLS